MSLDRGQPSGGLQLFHSSRGAGRPNRWLINDKFTPELDTCLACVDTEDGTVPCSTEIADWKSFADDRETLGLTILESTEAQGSTATIDLLWHVLFLSAIE